MTPGPGLSSADVAARRAVHGANQLPQAAAVPLWRRFLNQLLHFFALMLWAASVLALLAGMPQLAVAIVIVILLNGLFAFLQEFRAERAAERLRDLLPRRVLVLRDGRRQTVDAAELVPGDVVCVRAGDRIPADMTLTEVHGLDVDTSMLTGESVPTTPEAGDAVHAGTFAVEGEAMATVTATGRTTRLAQLARFTATTSRPATPLARELNRLVRLISGISLGVGLVFLAVAMLVGIRPADALLFGLGVTVALVPEGLLPTVSLSLAIGAQRMARRGALVRRLESVETLGSTTFICTDKTGTLTRNEMVVARVWMPGGEARIQGEGYGPAATVDAPPALLPALRALGELAAAHVSGHAVAHEGRWTAEGNPLDAALDAFARRVGVDRDGGPGREAPLQRFPFDPRRRRLSFVEPGRVIVRGAPEGVLDRCLNAEAATPALAAMVAEGQRVVAVAERVITDGTVPDSADAAERDLHLVGLLGVTDPPRPGVAESIAACRTAGIRVAMVTGDHPGTARAIGRQVGLWRSDALVLEGKDLPADDDRLGALVDCDGVILSRVSPEEKLRIARVLRQRGHIVAMTGDGVNDAPALHEAAIGVAMGRSGTDVAREAADLVLLDDDFSTIVAAIEQGRAAFANTRRFLTYHLTDNVAELAPFVVWALSGGQFPLAIGVLQVLCLDIGTDILPAVALGAEAANPRTLERAPGGQHLVDAPLLLRSLGLLGLTEAVVMMGTFVAALLAAGWRPGGEPPGGPVFHAASGAAFAAVVIGQAANVFACRSLGRSPWQIGWTSNRLVLLAVGAELLMLGVFLYVPPVARVLGQAPPTARGWACALLAAPAVLLVDTVHKRLRRAYRR